MNEPRDDLSENARLMLEIMEAKVQHSSFTGALESLNWEMEMLLWEQRMRRNAVIGIMFNPHLKTEEALRLIRHVYGLPPLPEPPTVWERIKRWFSVK